MTDEPPLGSPVDDLHAACLEARDAIRAHAKVLTGRAATWSPRPMPDWYRDALPERNGPRS